MNFLNFRIQVLVRIFLILILGYTAYFVLVKTPFSLLVFWLVLFAIIFFVDLIRYVEKTNRELSNFLMAIKQNDFSNIYPERKKKTQQLYHAFNVITHEFIKIRSEKESNFHFLKTVVEHSGVPLIAFNEKEEKITLMNAAAKNLFHIPYITKVESLSRVSPELLEAVRDLGSDEKVLIKIEISGEIHQLSVIAKSLVLQEDSYKVIAFHDINSELDQKEIESWQKLIRVLTHEIKNSVIPISTLTEVINQMFIKEDGEARDISELDEEEEEDLKVSMQTIERRSKGLVKFVNSYGNLAKVPKPQPQDVNLTELLEQIISLEKSELERGGIKVETELSKNIKAQVDPQMIEQVVINILKNAIEAMSGMENAKIFIELSKNAIGPKIVITDNGPGMSKETQDNIFVPFYTTKEHGSGIGLPLSRQIMRAHNGHIRCFSTPGQGTTFELQL